MDDHEHQKPKKTVLYILPIETLIEFLSSEGKLQENNPNIKLRGGHFDFFTYCPKGCRF